MPATSWSCFLILLLIRSSLQARAALPHGVKSCWRCEEVVIPEQPVVAPLTIITSFFNLHHHSKHKGSEYLSWAGNLVSRIDNPIVGFMGSDNLSTVIIGMRSNLPAVWLRYDDLWDMLPLHGMKQVYEEQHNKDPEHHFPELYAVWASKPWMVQAVSFHNPYRSRLFMWVDIGTFRDRSHPFRHWPDVTVISRLLGGDAAVAAEMEKQTGWYDPVLHTTTNNSNLLTTAATNQDSAQNLGASGPERIMLSALHDFNAGHKWDVNVATWLSDGSTTRHSDFLMGNYFVGTAKGIAWFADTCARVSAEVRALGGFAGKDQAVWDFIFLQNPWRFVLLPSRKLSGSCGGSSWWAFQYAFAHLNETKASCAKIREKWKYTLHLKAQMWLD